MPLIQRSLETVLPLAVSDHVARIADEAADAAFKVIHDGLAELGYPTTGDVTPGEALELEYFFQGCVLAMCMNNENIARMNEAS